MVDTFADAILALDDSMPNGTYIDMCSKLPIVDPARVTVPTLIMRGQYDGIAAFDDLVEFFKRLPNPDKQFTVMPGISHASFQQKNYRMVYHILYAYFTQPAPAHVGPTHAAPDCRKYGPSRSLQRPDFRQSGEGSMPHQRSAAQRDRP